MISTLSRLSFNEIKKCHHLDWRLCDNYCIGLGLIYNEHLHLNDLVEILNEFEFRSESKLDFIRNIPIHSKIDDLIDGISDRYDITEDFVRDYIDEKYWTYFISHPNINPFKFYTVDSINKDIARNILRNPALAEYCSYENINKLISLTSTLDHISYNNFEYDSLYKKVKRHRKIKEQSMIIIFEAINIPKVLCEIITSYYI
jgi:hypothetical protein